MTERQKTKRCFKCGFEKAATSENFAIKSSGKYGLENQCRECKKGYDALRYEKNKERLKAQQKRTAEVRKRRALKKREQEQKEADN